jgi:hypothetical protein
VAPQCANRTNAVGWPAGAPKEPHRTSITTWGTDGWYDCVSDRRHGRKENGMTEDSKPLSKACPDCRGRGVLPASSGGGKCPRCGGTGWVKGSGYQELPPKDASKDA